MPAVTAATRTPKTPGGGALGKGQPAAGLDPLLSADELAEYLGRPVGTLWAWRKRGHGPKALRIGGRLAYRVSDVNAWLAAQEVAS